MFQKILTGMLAQAGIQVNGKRSYDIRIKPGCERDFFTRVALHHSLGFGEAYMDGECECDDLKGFCIRVIPYLESHRLFGFSLPSIEEMKIRARQFWGDEQTVESSKRVGKEHYSFGNDWFEAMLGPMMTYTGGRWENSDEAFNLERSHEHCYDVVCRKLRLTPGMRVLDIGFGWGSFAAFAAEKYMAAVTGVTIAQGQYDYAVRKHADLIGTGRATFYLKDYRALVPTKKFGAVMSKGMFEHVGPGHYSEYFRKVAEVLEDDGSFLLETITSPGGGIDPFLNKYIFPGGRIPKPVQIAQAAAPYFVHKSTENLGYDYGRTIGAWRKNLADAKPMLLKRGYTEHQFRMFEFYLAGCQAKFELHGLSNDQMLFVKRGRGADPYTLRLAA